MLPGEHHDKTVDPNAKPASGRHAVSQRPQEILVHRVTFFIIFGVRAAKLKKAFFLVKWVVKLRKSIAEFHAPDIALEAFHRIGIFGFRLSQRGNIARVIIEESWLDHDGFQISFHQRVNQFATRCAWFKGDLTCSHHLRKSLIGRIFLNINAGMVNQTLADLQPVPGWGQVNLVPLKHDLHRPQHTLCHLRNHLFGHFHDHVVIRIRHVELELGKFGIVLERHAFVAEIPSDFVNAVHPANE